MAFSDRKPEEYAAVLRDLGMSDEEIYALIMDAVGKQIRRQLNLAPQDTSAYASGYRVVQFNSRDAVPPAAFGTQQAPDADADTQDGQTRPRGLMGGAFRRS